ncbi:MAG: RibD family protein [Vicinamibacteria bacterium]
MAASLDHTTTATRMRLDAEGRLVTGSGDGALLEWQPGRGWLSLLPADDERCALVDLYLPLCSATPSRPLVLGHLGQSLDGFIATPSGESRFVTGPENMVHMHRLRALADAVVVGAGTVAADDPQLTTRLVPGDSPLRVIFDPDRRLSASARVFTDGGTRTLYVTADGTDEPPPGAAEAITLTHRSGGAAMTELIAALRARGCTRIFVEGGGVTVSALVEAGLLDRLQVTVAPVLIGEGRPGIRLAAPERLSECRRPACRVFQMGRDVLFDCDLRAAPDADAAAPAAPLTRVL